MEHDNKQSDPTPIYKVKLSRTVDKRSLFLYLLHDHPEVIHLPILLVLLNDQKCYHDKICIIILLSVKVLRHPGHLYSRRIKSVTIGLGCRSVTMFHLSAKKLLQF